jgi:hypothetical protein
MLKILAITATVVAASAAGAADLTVFGVELGKPVNLPECPYKTAGGMKLYDVMPQSTCVHDPHALNGYGRPARELSFGRDEAPPIVKNWTAFLLEDDAGRVIGFHFLTSGVQTQAAVLSQLKEKYGAPTSVTPHTVRTAVGGPFESFDAKWSLPGLVVNFQGTTDRIDRGDVTIDLPEAAALRQQWSLNPKERKL